MTTLYESDCPYLYPLMSVRVNYDVFILVNTQLPTLLNVRVEKY